MCLLFETIQINNGEIKRLDYHQKRVGLSSASSLYSYIKEQVSTPINGIYKLRITYNSEQILHHTITPYTPLTITSLQIVEGNNIEYSRKYEDRTHLEALRDKRLNCDDILIVKNKLITECSYANILFYDGSEWITPLYPLLHGTQRAYLLDRGIIKSADIEVKDIAHFSKFMLINAMLEFNEKRAINYLYDSHENTISVK